MVFHSLVSLALLLAFVQVPAGTASQQPGSASPSSYHAATPASGTALQQRHPATLPSYHAPAQAAARRVPNSAAPSPQTPLSTTAAPSTDNSCPDGNCDEYPLHIKVANPDPVPPQWSMHERITWAANIVLVILGYVGIMLALSTLKKIERQTKYGEEAAAAAAKSAQAALLHAEAIVSSERPWILVSTELSRETRNGFAIIAVNRGRTPARVVAIPHKIEFAEDESRLPEVPQYQDGNPSIPFVPLILLPGESFQISTISRDDVESVCGTSERFHRVENWEEKIFLYGRVTYHDIISPQDEHVHQSAWCFWYIHGHQNSGLVPSGPRNYNMHT